MASLSAMSGYLMKRTLRVGENRTDLESAELGLSFEGNSTIKELNVGMVVWTGNKRIN